jgi:UDP-N-acetylglucosamine--N-acetylmuramyl-(pentapeptide) pyrophosphoryl-undecaprenol N-acetylglucosamine transferase
MALGLPGGEPVVVVFGGSLGARTLNELAVEAWGAAGPAVLHISGERDYGALRRRVSRSDYHLVPFMDDFGVALGAADLIVARAGGSVWEIAAAGKPAVLVPYPEATADHQRANAQYFEHAGGAIVVLDRDARENVPRLVEHLLTAPSRLEKMGAAMRAAARPDAAERIADELIALATARR